MSIELMMTPNHFILCHPLLLLPSIFPSIRVFPNGQVFTSGSRTIWASASISVLPMNCQGWFPLGLTGLIFLQSKVLSGGFCNTTVQKHQFFGPQPSLRSNSHSYMTTGKKKILSCLVKPEYAENGSHQLNQAFPQCIFLTGDLKGHISMAAAICVFYISTIFFYKLHSRHMKYLALWKKRWKHRKEQKYVIPLTFKINNPLKRSCPRQFPVKKISINT